MKFIIVAISTLLLCSACSSKPPEVVEGKKWGVNESGQWEEEKTYETTLIIVDDKPKHHLPKYLGKSN